MGPPASEGVAEILENLATDPQNAEAIVSPLLADPEFLPVSTETIKSIIHPNGEPQPSGNFLYPYLPLPAFNTDVRSNIITKFQELKTELKSSEQEKGLQIFDQLFPVVVNVFGTAFFGGGLGGPSMAP